MDNKRVCYVEIETNDNGTKQLKKLDGLAIKGTVHRKMGSTESDANISIANLTNSDVQYLTTYMSAWVKPQVKKMIRVYAGYFQTGYGRIFEGDITEAIPSDLPDTWLNIKAKALNYAKRIPVSFGVQNSTVKETAQGIAQELNLSFDWQATSQKNIGIFDYNGSKGDLVKQYNKLDEVVMYEDNGALKVVDKTAKRDNKNPVKVVSKDSGMIGLPELDEVGVKVKFLIDPSVAIGDWIQVKSVKLPIANGYYQVIEMNYDFASREQQFYCTATGKREGV